MWLHVEIHCVIVILSYTRSLNRIPCHAHTCAVQELVTALIPSVGPEYGRSLVRVEGQGFRRMPQLSCMFGTTIVSGSWMSNSVVECLSITMPAGTIVEVRVANNGLDFSSSSAAFVFKGAPHLPRDLQGRPHTPPPKQTGRRQPLTGPFFFCYCALFCRISILRAVFLLQCMRLSTLRLNKNLYGLSILRFNLMTPSHNIPSPLCQT